MKSPPTLRFACLTAIGILVCTTPGAICSEKVQSTVKDDYLLEFAAAIGQKNPLHSLTRLSVLIAKLERARDSRLSQEAVFPILDNSVPETKTFPMKELLAEALALRARTYVKKQQISKAKIDIEKAMALSKNNAEIRSTNALVLTHENQFVKALQELDRASQLKPDSEVPYELRFEIFKKLGDSQRAQRALETANQLRSKIELSEKTFFQNAQKVKQDVDAFAKSTLSLVKLDSRNPTYLCAHASSLFARNKFKSALDWASYSLAIDPAQTAPYLVRGNAFVFLGRPDLVVREADSLLRISPHSTDARILNATAYLLSNQPESALIEINKAIKSSPDSADGYRIRAHIHSRIGSIEKAIRDARKGLLLDSNSAESYEVLGMNLMTAGKFAEGHKYLEIGADKSQDELSKWHFESALAGCCRYEGLPEEARYHFDLAKKLGCTKNQTEIRLRNNPFWPAHAVDAVMCSFPKHAAPPLAVTAIADSVLRIAPSDPQAIYEKAVALMRQEQPGAAATCFEEVGKLKKWRGRVATQAAILEFLCRERTGTKDSSVLGRCSKPSNIQSNLIAYLAGDSSLSALLEKTSTQHGQIITKALVAYHLVSQKRLDEAIPLLTWVSTKEDVYAEEFAIAESELQRLGRSEKSKSANQ